MELRRSARQSGPIQSQPIPWERVVRTCCTHPCGMHSFMLRQHMMHWCYGSFDLWACVCSVAIRYASLAIFIGQSHCVNHHVLREGSTGTYSLYEILTNWKLECSIHVRRDSLTRALFEPLVGKHEGDSLLNPLVCVGSIHAEPCQIQVGASGAVSDEACLIFFFFFLNPLRY